MPWENLRNDIHSEPQRKEDYTNCFPRLTAKAKIKIRKAEIFFFPRKEHLWPLGVWNTLSSSSAPKGMPCRRSEVPRSITSSVILSHLLQQALCLRGGEWNQQSRGWLAKEKQKLNSVRFIWTQALFCVAYSNCFHFFELVSAKVKTIRLPSKSQ